MLFEKEEKYVDESTESFGSILISPRLAEEYVRNRGMKRVVTPSLLALLTACCLLPAPFVYWQHLPVGSMPAVNVAMVLMVFGALIAFFVYVLCEFGYIFPYAGGVYTFARQETGVLGGYVAGMAAAVVHLCLGACAVRLMWFFFIQGMAEATAFFALGTLMILILALASYRTDYYFVFIFIVFCGALAAILLFFIAVHQAKLLTLSALQVNANLLNSQGLMMLFFTFCGVAGLASVAEELEMRNGKWHRWVLPVFCLAALVFVLQIAVVTAVAAPVDSAFSLFSLIERYYSDDIVLQKTIYVFGFCGVFLPLLTGLYLASRQFFAFARSGYMPSYFSHLLTGRQTPLRSLILTLVVMLGLARWGKPGDLLAMAAYSFCLEIVLVLYSWWRLQLREPELFSNVGRKLLWLGCGILIIFMVFFVVLSIGQFVQIFIPVIVWFVLIMYVYYRGGNYIRDEAPDEAAALQKEKGNKVALR
jgi:amino acid transporter